MTTKNPGKLRRMTVILATLALVLGLAGGAATLAQGPEQPTGDGDVEFTGGAFGPRFEALAHRLDLTPQQEEAIVALQQDNQQNAIEVRKQLLRLHNELEGEMLADEPQEATVVELTDKIGQLRTELQVERARTQLAVRELLTPEQRDKMMMLKATHRGAGKHGRHGGEGRWAGRRAGRCGGGCGGGYAGGYGGHGPHGTGTAECDGDGPKGPHGRGGQDRDR